EVLANIAAALDQILLILAVHDFTHALHEQAVLVVLQKRVPIAAPDHFDDVPAGALEGSFQLLDDLAVAAHRTIEALQVAVDDKNQIVEPFAGSERDGAERFWLIALAVAYEAPDALLGRVLESA